MSTPAAPVPPPHMAQDTMPVTTTTAVPQSTATNTNTESAYDEFASGYLMDPNGGDQVALHSEALRTAAAEAAALRAANNLVEEQQCTPFLAATPAQPADPTSLSWVDTPLGLGADNGSDCSFTGNTPANRDNTSRDLRDEIIMADKSDDAHKCPPVEKAAPCATAAATIRDALRCATDGLQMPTALARLVTAASDAKRWSEERTKGMRAWREFADKSQFSTPSQMEAVARARINLTYFRINYLIITLVLTLWTVATHIVLSLSLLACFGAWRYYHWATEDGKELRLFGRNVSSAQAYASLIGGTVLVFWLGGGSSVIFWLVASLMGTIVGHAMMRHAASTPESLALETLQAAHPTRPAENVQQEQQWV